jgi:hypothetical protein
VTVDVTAVSSQNATHELKGTVTNVKDKSEIEVTIDGTSYDAFRFVPTSGALSAVLKLNPGSHTIVVNAATECGTAGKTTAITVASPCMPPKVSYEVTAVNRPDATHELKGTISNIKNRSDIKVTVNGSPFEGFLFTPGNGAISASFKLNAGSNTITVSSENECGEDSGSRSIIIEEEKACGIRINPGNSPWQFCLVTNSGTYTRENLSNSNFTYSGPAASLFFMPIGGGGEATVNGKPYSIKPGQYYLFTGNLTVTVSTKNPGSMGQWSVCIIASKAPVFGNGNNRPISPCEESQDDTKPRKNDPSQ